MPSPMATLPFTAKPAPAAASAGGTAPARDEASAGSKPAFDDLVRRPAKRDDAAPRKPAAPAGETAARPPGRADAAAARGKGEAARRTDEEGAVADTVPQVPPSLPELPAPAALALPDPAVPILADPSAAVPLPDGAAGLDVTASADLLAGKGAAAPAWPVPPAPGAPQAADTPAADATALPAPAPAEAQAQAQAKAPLQNLLSFAAHLATGQVAAALPDAVDLGRDVVDALRRDDADTAPAGNLLAGVGASHAPLGLSRTETVNATEAPGADLHGGRFDEDIGDAVRWMADQKIGHAHIKVTPNELGTVEIRLRLEGDRVHADFASPQADVRQALESSLPRLRDMLGQHGFQLAHADVGQQHAPPSQGTAPSHPGEDGPGPADTSADAPRTVRMTALGLLDAYA